jgi:hypothetical protein
LAGRETSKRKTATDIPIKRPRQARLPGVDDPKIEELESLALDYAAIRDKRVALSAQELPLKNDLLAAMKREKRTHYKRDGIEINFIMEKENIKVKINKIEKEASEQ